MNKYSLRKIAKEWCKGMVQNNCLQSFGETLTYEEKIYVLGECQKIGERITKGDACVDLANTINKYIKTK